MKISEYGNWYKMYAMTGPATTATVEAGDIETLMSRAEEVFSKEATHYLRLHMSLNGREVWQTKASFKERRWDIVSYRSSDQKSIYTSWCNRNKISSKLLEVNNKLSELNI